MTKILLPLLAALLLSGCTFGVESREKAMEALAYAAKLERSGYDMVDESILEPALSYIPEKGDAVSKADLWYLLGRIQFNREGYAQAMVSFEKALHEVEAAGDRHREGLVCRAMADTYNRTYNVREDSLYLLRALSAFEAEGDSLFALEVRLRLAIAYYNAHEWDKARSCYSRVIGQSGIDSSFFYFCQSSYGSFLLDMPTPDPDSSLACFERCVPAVGGSHPEILCDYGYALHLNGYRAEAAALWDSLERQCPEIGMRLNYRRYCILKQEGRPASALSSLERSTEAQDSLFRVQTSEVVSRARRDYQEAVAEGERLTAVRERDGKRTAWLVGILTVMLLMLAGIVFRQKSRGRLLAARQALDESQRVARRLTEAEKRHKNVIHDLNRHARTRQSELEGIRSEYLYMLRDGYRRLAQLFEAREFASTQRESEAVLFKKVSEILKDIDGDKKGFRRLIRFIEDHLDHPVADLKTDIPTLAEEDIQLFCYLVIGYDAPLISLLLRIDNLNTVYSRKSRLLQRIRKLPVAKARRYLDLVV